MSAPAWHKRPTGPGLWLIWPRFSGKSYYRREAVRLTKTDIKRGNWSSTACVYGPIPEPPEELRECKE